MENSNEDDEGQNLWYARTLKVSRSAADFAGSLDYLTVYVLLCHQPGAAQFRRRSRMSQNTLHKLIAKSESG